MTLLPLRRAILALGDRRAGFAPEPILRRLEESQHWGAERLREHQAAALRTLLQHAGRHVPFYRETFQELGFDPAALRSVEDLAALPVLDKAAIGDRLDDFVSERAPRPLRWLRTSGSSGHPFRFVLTPLAQSYKIASRVRFRRWYGVERWDRQLVVGGIAAQANNRASAWKGRLHRFATNRVEIHASELNAAGLERAAATMGRERFASIMGYPTGIVALADHFATTGPRIHRPRAIFSNSETLFPWMRDRIREGLGVEPRSDYVATEGSIGHECPAGRLHVDMEETVLEILPRPGEDGGEVVVTFLHTLDFPLVRYRLGDVAAWGEASCPCGRGLVVVDGLVGRQADAIVLADGRRFTAANINMRIAHFPFIRRIRQYQIAQLSPTRLELRVLDAAETDDGTLADFAAELGRLFPEMSVGAVRMPELPREQGGKFRPVLGLRPPS